MASSDTWDRASPVSTRIDILELHTASRAQAVTRLFDALKGILYFPEIGTQR